MTRKLAHVIFILLIIKPASILGQSVTDISVRQSGDDIAITYNLNFQNQLKTFNIDLYVSLDGGRNFTGPLYEVSGHVGERVQAGSNRMIKWRVLEEFADLNSDDVVFEIRGSYKVNFELEFVYIEEGSFKMGSNNGPADEKPVHKVNLEAFYLSKYEVSQSLWYEVMNYNPSGNKSCPDGPVENVSYTEVLEFLNKISNADVHYRLPTEAEWEYAATISGAKKIPPYSGSFNIDAVSWYLSNSGGKSHPVGEKFPNAFGCYDMSGNVQEWVSDYYSPNSYKRSSGDNPLGPLSGSTRVIRGGGYNMANSHSRIYSRNFEQPGYKSSNLGFRIVKEER